MCDKVSIDQKHDKKDIKEENYYVNASFITKKSFLPFIKGSARQEYVPTPTAYENFYPKPNIYYAFNEDTNPFTRLNYVEKTRQCESHFKQPEEPYIIRDPYCEVEATKKYLTTPPTCFVIFGKPGLSSTELATTIAEAWNCVLISPVALIQLEIERRTEKGRTITDILRAGEHLGPEIIMNLMKARVNMRDVMHRGYVVEGIPLFPNENVDYSSYPSKKKNPSNISNDDATKYSDFSSCENKHNDSNHDGVEQDTILESKSLCPEGCRKKLDDLSCKVQGNFEQEIPEIIDEIFTAWPVKPSIIIYALCPDEDLARKREFRRLNPLTGQTLDFNSIEIDEGLEISFPHDREIEVSPESKYLLKRIDDTDCNVRAQCDLYRRLALPTIEKWVLLHNPQNVIRVDGRTRVSRMFQIISARLRILPLPRVLLPKRLMDRKEVEFEGESPTEDILENEFEYKTNEEALREFATRETVAPRFPWKLSPWKFLCPVELAKGRTIEGAPEYAVRFMNQIFFLSSPTNVDLFVDNPRTFLSTSKPRSTCKIAVFGPNFSGKSQLCEELALIFGGTVINVKEVERAFMDDRIKSRMIDANRENIGNIVEALRRRLEAERTRRELSRVAELQSWCDEIVAVIDRFIYLLETFTNDEDNAISEELRDLRGVLSRNNLAHVESDRTFRESSKKDRTLLIPYAPEYLRLEEPPVRELTEDDPEVLATIRRHFRDIYEKSKDLTVDEKAEIVVKNVKNVPDRSIDDGLSGDGGYILDGMYTDVEVWKKVTQESGASFEDTIILFEDEPYERLLEKWRETCRSKQGKNEYHEGATLIYEDDTSIEEEGKSDMEELYIQHLKEFASQWEMMKDLIASTSRTMINCNVRNTNIPEYVINSIKDRYSTKAILMTDEDKAREKEAIEEAENIDVEGEEEEEEEETGEHKDKLRSTEDNRRLGDTNHYCPVALSKYNIFRRGKEEFSVVFANKIYLLSAAQAAGEFLEEPERFCVPFAKPPATIPPLRIGIVGPPGCGKTTLSNSLSREYGLTHVNCFERFALFMKRRTMRALEAGDILVSTENLVGDEELPEDLHDERYNTDEDVVRGFILRYWKTGGVLPRKMLQECLLSFFEPPYDKHSIMFDGFPSCQEDVESMLENYAVPEAVIRLNCSLDNTLERMLPPLLEFWEKKQEEEIRMEEDRYMTEMEDYSERREKWIRETLIERHVRNRKIQRMAENWENYEEGESGEWYNEIDDPDMYDNDLGSSEERRELEDIWRQENPEPILSSDREDSETAKERITRELTEKYERDIDKSSPTRKMMEDESINWMEVDANRGKATVLMEIMRILDPYVFRDVSIFERTYRVDLETAERLLDCGYYFLSSFGRWCPVQLHKNTVPLQMFLPMEARGEIYPVLHRQYVYFLAGDEALSNFRKDPLKYLEQDSCAPLVPLRISIIGPPKCGKTTVASRFADAYGLKLISRGKALRHLLKHFGWTHQAHLLEPRLRAGHVASGESIIRAIEMYSIDPRSISQGLVFDGFPTNREELEELARLGLQPMLVIDLKANLDFCLECLSRDADKIEKPPNFSRDFLSHRYFEWQSEQAIFRDWFDKLYRNVVELDATRSKWCVWTRADKAMRTRFFSIRKYFRESDFDKVHALEFMCVSPYEFKRRQSLYEAYCPVCLFHGCMKNSTLQPHHRGVLQFREYFYWICPEHMDDFMKSPLNFLPPANTAVVPQDRPCVLNEIVDVEHPCWAKRLRLNGFCPVTYLDSLPDRKLTPGKPELGILYKDSVYLFCARRCRDIFLLHCTKYADVNLKFHGTLALVEIRDLPNFGFLEQTVAEFLVQAVNQVGVIRPKIPGLTAAITAAIFIGVYLKTHNVSCKLNEVDIYERVSRRILRRDRIIKMILRAMKKRLNPYVAVPRYSSTRRVPVPDARFDYLCQYYKPVRKVPAFLNVVDIAGLVKGAAEGLGLGNSFLSHINACDGIFHLCRAFEDDDVTHVEGDVNPVRDLEIISEELRLKDIEFLNGHLEKLEKLVVRGNDKKLKPEYDTLLKVKSVMVDDKKHIRFADWSANDIEVLNKYLFLTSKPVIYLVNLSEKDYIRKKNKWLVKIKEWVDKNDPGAVLIPFSGVFEMKLFTMEDAERTKYIEDNKVASALDKIIVQGYKALQLQYFFTVGHDEVKAWTIQKGTKAPQAGGKIHTDFERGFIMAEVMKFEDLKKEGSETAVKAAGKYRSQGRNYVVEDGDIVLFKFNAGAGLKDAKKK